VSAFVGIRNEIELKVIAGRPAITYLAPCGRR
jgi:hypothetical protein